MNWIWKRLASYVQVKTQVEFEGISEQALEKALRQEAILRLQYVEAVVFSDETEEKERIRALKAWFCPTDNKKGRLGAVPFPHFPRSWMIWSRRAAAYSNSRRLAASHISRSRRSRVAWRSCLVWG